MRVTRILFLFLSIQFFLYNMGLLGRRLSILASVVSLFVFVLLSLPVRRYPLRTVYLVPFVALVLTLVVITRGHFEEVLVFPVFLASLLFVPEREDHGQGERERLLIGVFLFATMFFIQFNVPSLWHFIQNWGLGFSRLAGALIGQPYLLGPTAAGIPIVLLFFMYHTAVAVSSRERGARYFVKTVILLFVIQAIVLVLLTPLAILIQLANPKWDLLVLNPEVFVFAGLLLTLLVKPPSAVSFEKRRGLGLSLVTGVVVLLCSVFLTLRPGPGSNEGTVLIYDKGYLNWRVPDYSRFGEKSGGMFGNLPTYLKGLGFDVEIVDSMDRETLSRGDALIIINVLEFFGDEEKRAVEGFVCGGGGLLALGDHTGVKGIRGPFNHLLEPYGIRFVFDSATFFTKGWGEEAVLMPHPITHGIPSPEAIEIWVGASLEIERPARPVIVGRYGYSDFGDFAAIDRAYLGNRIFDPGEQLGDIVLVAAAHHGTGRVLVFGDTSPFQNLAIVQSYLFVSRAVSWLVSGGAYSAVRGVILALVIAVAAVVVFVKRDVLLAGIVSVALLAGIFAGLAPRRVGRSVAIDLSTAVIDASHFERFDKLTWYDDCIGGLQLNLMRAGYLPVVIRDFTEEQIARSDLVTIIAPVKSFTERENRILDRFMEEGGWILYSCGTEEKGGSERFLRTYGLELLDVPLASFADSVMGAHVNVSEGWGVGIVNPEARVVAQKFGFPYIVEVRRGNGGMILIADSNFLLNKNLEGLKEFYPGNIRFMRMLLSTFQGSFPGDSTAEEGRVGG